MKAEEAKRLTELEKENKRLKKLLAEAHLDKGHLTTTSTTFVFGPSHTRDTSPKRPISARVHDAMKTRKSTTLNSLIDQHRRKRNKRFNSLDVFLDTWRDTIRVSAITMFGVIGYVALAVTPIPLIIADNRPIDEGGGLTSWRMVGGALHVVGAVLWIASGIMCWRRRWLFMYIGAILGLFMIMGALRLFADLDIFATLWNNDW
jgi:hypothetical protein